MYPVCQAYVLRAARYVMCTVCGVRYAVRGVLSLCMLVASTNTYRGSLLLPSYV